MERDGRADALLGHRRRSGAAPPPRRAPRVRPVAWPPRALRPFQPLRADLVAPAPAAARACSNAEEHLPGRRSRVQLRRGIDAEGVREGAPRILPALSALERARCPGCAIRSSLVPTAGEQPRLPPQASSAACELALLGLGELRVPEVEPTLIASFRPSLSALARLRGGAPAAATRPQRSQSPGERSPRSRGTRAARRKQGRGARTPARNAAHQRVRRAARKARGREPLLYPTSWNTPRAGGTNNPQVVPRVWKPCGIPGNLSCPSCTDRGAAAFQAPAPAEASPAHGRAAYTDATDFAADFWRPWPGARLPTSGR